MSGGRLPKRFVYAVHSAHGRLLGRFEDAVAAVVALESWEQARYLVRH
jgi:hypothetical protein